MKTYIFPLHTNYNIGMDYNINIDKGIIFLTLISIILLFVITNLAWKKYQSEAIHQADYIAEDESECLLNLSPCETSFQIIQDLGNIKKQFTKSVQLKILKRPITLLEPFKLELVTEFDSIKKVYIDLKGSNMDMGPNRVELTQSQKVNEDSKRFYGQGILPICSVATMYWQAHAYIQTSKALYLSRFNFVTYQ